MLQSKNYFDFNIVSATVFGQNNFAYLPGKDIRIIPLLSGKDILATYPPNGNNFLYFRNKNTKDLSAISNVYALGGMVQFHEQVIAFHTAFRSYNSGSNIPYEIPIFGVESLGFGELQNVNFIDHDFSAASLSWAEFGISYALAFYQESNHHWAAGITVNVMEGLGASFIDVQNIDYVVLNRNTVQINDMNLDAGFSLPVDYQSNDVPIGPLFKGLGLGVDLGITYTLKNEGYQRNHSRRICEEDYNDYQWRAGVSILDLGSISFKSNAELHRFNNVNVLLKDLDQLSFINLNELMKTLSDLMLVNPDASSIGNSFKMGLPTALSAQFDYHLNPNWYINATIVQPFSVSKYSVRRPAQIAITPRYERSWFEIMLPVSLYEYRTTRIGLAMRLGVLTLGTDQLGSLVGLGKIQGVDFYASVKINFRKGICLFGNVGGACSTDYNYRPRKNSLFNPGR